MDTAPIISVDAIIARAGGEKAVAQRIQKTTDAIRKWRTIPERHWDDLIVLCRQTIGPTDLHLANSAAPRAPRAGGS